jgi:hypothetical protein
MPAQGHEGKVSASSPERTQKSGFFRAMVWITSIICPMSPDASLTPAMFASSAIRARRGVEMFFPVLPAMLYTMMGMPTLEHSSKWRNIPSSVGLL